MQLFIVPQTFLTDEENGLQFIDMNTVCIYNGQEIKPFTFLWPVVHKSVTGSIILHSGGI